MSKEITIEEVGKHSGENSAWMIIHNDVYDVTKFLGEHPGGADSLLEYAGKDGTQAFEDVAHSDDARELMIKFKIGSVPPGQQTQPGNCTNCERNNPLRDPKQDSRPPRDTRPYYHDQSSSNALGVAVDKMSRSYTGTEHRSEVVGRRMSSGSSPQERLPRGLPCERGQLERKSDVGARRISTGVSTRRERMPRGLPCERNVDDGGGHSKLKMAIVALAGAVIIGIILKKYM